MSVFFGVQADLAFDPGIGLGRFMVARAGEAPPVACFAGKTLPDRGRDVLIASTSGAPLLPDRRGLSRRPRRLARDLSTEDVWLTQLTFVRGDHGFAEDRGEDALRALLADEDAADRLVTDAFAVFNRATVAARIATGDPGELVLDRAVARSVRIGYATAETINDGRLSSAFAVTAPKSPGGWREAVPTSEFVAAVLAARAPLLDVDRLLLRLAGDVAEEAYDRAAAQLPTLVEVAVVELRGSWPDDEVEELRRVADELAQRGIHGQIGQAERIELTRVVRTLWAAARRRTDTSSTNERRTFDEYHRVTARHDG